MTALQDARAYMVAAPHDFGGHKAEAIRASDEAIRQLNLALAYRAREDRRWPIADSYRIVFAYTVPGSPGSALSSPGAGREDRWQGVAGSPRGNSLR